ncbi:MAG TPA: hypothetical protein VG733_00955 [Chthoniobacteraceae bacterium]|nr:hypothetical protein [Chthoniobacteraceae bacterium]
MKKLTTLLSIAAVGLMFALPARAADDDTKTIKGEVLDMACYLDHGASGENHAACAQKCISSGLPVGIKDADGKVYLIIGAHKPLNDELAPLAAKQVSIKGKVVSRDGINMIENAEIVK